MSEIWFRMAVGGPLLTGTVVVASVLQHANSSKIPCHTG